MAMKKCAAVLLWAAFGVLLSVAQTYDVRDTVSGQVRGLLNETSQCREWRGVYFAANTGGQNRWLGPQPRAPWAPAVLDATAFGAGCPQIHHNPDVPTNQSEDCLNVNVFAPARCSDPAACSLPVLIWFHGGTFTEGWNEGPFDLYDGCNMAQGGDVVVVTANYRLGAVGFLVTSGESGEPGDYALRGNMGLRDQKAAMEWVHLNVAAFGGDPELVTLFGQSAGAMSVGLHYVSPEMYGGGLFHRAIMESNYPGANIHDLAGGAALGNAFCQDLGCWLVGGGPQDGVCDVGCMRSAALESVVAAWSEAAGAAAPFIVDNHGHWVDGAMGFAPVVDGDFLVGPITTQLEAGAFNASIPALFGTNSGDGATFIYSVDEPLPYGLWERAVPLLWGEANAASILAFYEPAFPKDATPDGRAPLAQAVNDYLFRCGSEVYGREVAARGGRAFGYVYDHVPSFAAIFPTFGLPAVCEEIPCHSEEIPFVFGNGVPGLNATFTPDEATLSAQVVRWWANFARIGDPNGAGGPDDLLQAPLWPPFDGVARQSMRVTTPQSALDGGEALELCGGLWDAVGYLY